MFPCRAAVHSSTGGESPSVFPSHIHGCDCASTVLIPPELFDSAVSLVLSDMETHYFPTFGTVNPFFLGYVQLFHFGARCDDSACRLP